MLDQWLYQRFRQAQYLLPQWQDQWTSNGVCTGLCLQVANMVFDGTFSPPSFAQDLALRFERAVKKHRIYKMESRIIVANNDGLSFADVIHALRDHFAIVATPIGNGVGLGDLATTMGTLGNGFYSLALGYASGGGHTLMLLRLNKAMWVFDPSIGLLVIKNPITASVVHFVKAYRDQVLKPRNKAISGWDVAKWERQRSQDFVC